jgi:ABC-type transporter Mla maintaining outer membrane lipid asymmetry ATPase subunit MlaF
MVSHDMGPDPIVLKNIEKQYGALRPLRVRELRVAPCSSIMLIGFDRPAAEVLVNLITGATLPDAGEVVSFGRPTRELVNSDEWLSFVDRFGMTSDRIVLLEALTVAQNLAISFDLELDPIPEHVLARVSSLAGEVGIEASALNSRVADALPLLRSRIYLARALVLEPAVLILEHPTANLGGKEITEYAAVVRRVAQARALAVLGLTMDEKFGKAAGGRLLFWQPATGEIRPRLRFPLWRGRTTSER